MSRLSESLILAISVLAISSLGCDSPRENPKTPPSTNAQVLLRTDAEGSKTNYLIDYEYIIDKDTLFATRIYLVIFNPNEQNANLDITVYFEDNNPKIVSRIAPAKQTTVMRYSDLRIKPGQRFALKVESSHPIFCQATQGWNNTGNNLRSDAPTKSPKGIREIARSYTAISQLKKQWFLADGIIINQPTTTWEKESEWLILLNPHDDTAQVALNLYYPNKIKEHKILLPGRRVKRIFMDQVAEHNIHYGLRVISDRAIAAQWLRELKWYDSAELMAYWSLPLFPSGTNTSD